MEMERWYILWNIAAFFYEKKEDRMQYFDISMIKQDQSESIERTFFEADVIAFANVTGDKNPAHLDEDYASKTIFQKPIVHGFFVGSLFSQIIGTKFPGLGTIYTFQSMKFTKPVFFGDTITATVKAKEIIREKNRVVLECIAINQHQEVVIIGEATVMPPRMNSL